MSDLYKRINDLCDEKSINITLMCKQSGANRASLTDLKQGRKQSLSAETLYKIASYFSVSVDYLLGATNERKPAPGNAENGLSKEAMELLNLFEGAPEDKRDIVLDLLRLYQSDHNDKK